MHQTTWERFVARDARRRLRPAAVAAFALDLLIAIYAINLVLSLIPGIDLGPFTTDSAEKPILILLIAIPVRIAVGGSSWLLDRVVPRTLDIPALRARIAGRIPPAAADVAFAVITTRIAAIAIGFLANLLYPEGTGRGFELPFAYQKLLETFAAFDSGWYFDIARRGYYYSANHQSSIAFFPLYPLTIRAVAWPFGGGEYGLWIASILVSWASFVLALFALHRFTERVVGTREAARRTVLYLAVFPFGLFFTRVYAESVFLLTSVIAVAAAYDRRWLLAGVFGGLATLARPNGILIGLPLFLMAIRGWSSPRDLVSRFAALAFVPLALAGYCVYVYTLSGDPLAWLSAQEQWNYSLFHPPWRQLLKMLGRLVKHGFYDYFFVAPMTSFRLMHGMTALVFLTLIPGIFKRLGIAMGAYVLVSLLVPLSGSALEGVGRYASVLFPAFMLLGSFKSERLHEAILIVSALFLALFIGLFVTLRPIY